MLDKYNLAVREPWITEPITDTQYDIIETDDMITIRFQGSCSRLDWLQNFSFWKKPYKHMKHTFFVHAGFIKKYKSVQDSILDRIGDKEVEILGYSQGAALALLCHEDVTFRTGKQPKTIVFGCPRVFSWIGGIILKDRLSNVERVENGNDIVTKIPFVWMGYRHYGTKKHIGTKRHWWKLSIKDHLIYRENLC